LDLQNNQLTGNLDPIICGYSRSVDEVYADCAGDPPKIICSCCNGCYPED